MSIGKRIKILREREGLSQVDLGRIIGVSDKAISTWENDIKTPRMGKLQALADYFGVPKSYIIDGAPMPEQQLSFQMPTFVQRPRLGTIACGTPILAEQNIDGYDSVPDYVKCDFTLLCKGDSMTGARINDGDIVCIKQQSTVENGQIAAVLINGEFSDDATLKRVRFMDDGIALWPENPSYAPMIFTGENMAKVHILGLATHFISTIH